MKHIKNYYAKIEAILAARKGSKRVVKGTGLAAPTGSMKPKEDGKDKKDLEVIADYVQGIREAREELLNASK